jgi:hypothetical protein
MSPTISNFRAINGKLINIQVIDSDLELYSECQTWNFQEKIISCCYENKKMEHLQLQLFYTNWNF